VRCHSLLAASAALLFVAPAAITVAQDATASYGAPGSRGAAAGALAVPSREIPYSEFVELVDQGKVAAVVVSGERIRGELESGWTFITVSPETDNHAMIEVSVMPRGRALGLTVYLPEADRLSHSKEALDSRICALLGGRVAEALIFGADHITSGASNDIRCATEIARAMVTQYGMSDTLGPLAYCDDGEQPFLDGKAVRIKRVSEGTARAIDAAVREVVDRNYARARQILEARLDALHLMAEALTRYEAIDRDQINAIMRAAIEGTAGEPEGRGPADPRERV
jgi:ATP-dependent Zn protease